MKFEITMTLNIEPAKKKIKKTYQQQQTNKQRKEIRFSINTFRVILQNLKKKRIYTSRFIILRRKLRVLWK